MWGPAVGGFGRGGIAPGCVPPGGDCFDCSPKVCCLFGAGSDGGLGSGVGLGSGCIPCPDIGASLVGSVLPLDHFVPYIIGFAPCSWGAPCGCGGRVSFCVAGGLTRSAVGVFCFCLFVCPCCK